MLVIFGPVPGWHHCRGWWCKWFCVLEHHCLQESSSLSSYCVWPMETQLSVVVGGGLWGKDALRGNNWCSCTKVTAFIIPDWDTDFWKPAGTALSSPSACCTYCSYPFSLYVFPGAWWVGCTLELGLIHQLHPRLRQKFIALCEHLCFWYLARGYLISALKVFC